VNRPPSLLNMLLSRHTRRREFIALLSSAGVTWSLAAHAQQAAKLPTIGFLGALTQSAHLPWTSAFTQRLRELGWIEGHTIAIEYRWADGRGEHLIDIAAEFVQLKVAVIVTGGTAAVTAAKQATSVIPIVFATAGDPVRLGLVASLARPGGNITGISNQSADLPGKRLELLRDLVPGLRRVAVMANVGASIGVLELDEVHAAARKLGLEVVSLEIRRAEDIGPALESVKGNADALYVVSEPLVNTNRVRITTLANAGRLPAIYAEKGYVEAGGLTSYGSNYSAQWVRAAELVDKILRGAKPGDIPVEQPTKFDLAFNLTTAKALGIAAPPSFLAQADDVIE
jgi:putative tryptophan/tyrosine transport system substrate-binding protein